MILKDEHKTTGGVVDKENSYEHYYGFATIENNSSVKGSVWFKRGLEKNNEELWRRRRRSTTTTKMNRPSRNYNMLLYS